jgi:hypothetical protein
LTPTPTSTPTPAAPVVTTSTGTLAYTENAPATPIDGLLTVTDADSQNLASASVAITSNFQTTQDVLAFTSQAGITGSFNPATGVLPLSGIASVADYQAVLRSVTYANTSDNPSPTSRTVTVTVNDGVLTSNDATVTIAITPVNDAPVNTVPAGVQTVNEDTDLTFSTANGNALSVADVDAGPGAVEVTVSAAHGTITPATGSGAAVAGSGSGSAVITGTLTQVNAALNGLRYRGNADFNSSRGSETLTITTNDLGNSGSGGARSDTDVVAITVTPVNDAPVAEIQNRTVQANMKITLSGLLTGATDPDTGDSGYTAVFSINQVQLGTCPAGSSISNIDATAGTFDFDPAPGSVAPCTLQYRIDDNGNPGVATSASTPINITMAGSVIWFVDDTATAPGDGRLSAPFTTLAQADARDSAGQRVFLFAGNYTGPFSLNHDVVIGGEWLIGQGRTGQTFDEIFGAPPPGTIPRPTMGSGTATVQDTVTLNTGARVEGLAISGGASPGMNDPTAAISGVTVSQVSVTTTTGTGVALSDIAGSLAFTGLTTSGGTGASLTGSNSGATFSFTGVAITSSGANPGFASTGGGTLTITGTANTITSATGTALNITSTTIGASGVTFRSISASGATNGIVLSGTGSGAFTVAGDGGATNNGSGGTINGASGNGIVINGATNVSLGYMNITNSGVDGININNISGFTLNRTTITDNSSTSTLDHAGVRFGNFSTGTAVNGTIRITDSSVSFSSNDNLAVGIGSGTSTWTITGSTFSFSGGNGGGDGSADVAGNNGVNFEIRNAASVTSLTFTGNTLEGNFAGGLLIQPAAGATGSLVATISNNTWRNNNIHLDLRALGAANMTYTVTNNSFVNTTRTATSGVDGASHAVNVFQGTPSTGTLNLRFETNTIGAASTAGSGSSFGDGIRVVLNSNGQGRVLINGNFIRQAPIGHGIDVIGRDGNGQLDVTITNDNVDHTNLTFGPGSNAPLAAISVVSDETQGSSTTHYRVRSDVRGNTVPPGAASDFTAGFITLAENQTPPATSTLELVDDPTGPAGQTAAQQLAGANTGSTGVSGNVSLIAGPIGTPP